MHCTTVKENTATNGTTALSLRQALDINQAALRTVLTARCVAEKGLKRCKTTTSAAAKGYAETMEAQQQIAEARLHDVRMLSGAFDAAALAAKFGDRILAKYVVWISDERGVRESLDVLRINQVRIAFFNLAIESGYQSFETRKYWFDMPDGSGHVGVEVKS